MRKALIALAATLPMTLAAQSFDLNGGMQVGVNKATGDLNDKKPLGVNDAAPGVHFGGHLDFNFTRQHQLRLHLDFIGFAGDSYGYAYDNRKNTIGVAQFGADYVLNFQDSKKGPYFLAGASFNKITAKATFDTRPDIEVNQSGRVGVRIGGGYTFNHWFSLEGHLNSVSVDKNGADGLGYDNMSWIGVSAVFRFGR